MRKSTNIWNYKNFETANGKPISEIDYINLVIRELNIPIDLFNFIINMVVPNFIVKDGFIFRKSTYDVIKYENDINKNQSIKEIQYWMNLINFSAISEELSEANTKGLAKKIVNSWNLIIDQRHADCHGRAIILEDDGDIFITIS